MNNNKNQSIVFDRSNVRDFIAHQVQEFLDKGGEIQVLETAFEIYSDPKCRLGEDMGYFK